MPGSTDCALVSYKEIKSYFQEPQAVMVRWLNCGFGAREVQRNLRVSIQIYRLGFLSPNQKYTERVFAKAGTRTVCTWIIRQ